MGARIGMFVFTAEPIEMVTSLQLLQHYNITTQRPIMSVSLDNLHFLQTRSSLHH